METVLNFAWRSPLTRQTLPATTPLSAVVSAFVSAGDGAASTRTGATHMGIWIELGIFLVVIAFGFWQLHDVKKAQAERRARERAAKSSEVAGSDQKAGVREP
jgi:hypothetical protein